MVQKRPYTSDPKLELPAKNARNGNENDDDGSKLVSFSENVLPEDASNEPCFSGDDDTTRYHTGDEEPVAADGIAQEPSESCEEDQDVLEVPSCVCPGAENLDPDNPIRKRARLIDIYQFLLESPPLKSVPAGPNHQADIPKWNHDKNNPESEAASESKPRDEQENIVLLGACVLPKPELESDDINQIGKGRTDCSCRDLGSVRCVKQHIVEAREKLKGSLGKERFKDLGFDKMGEFANQKWSLLEEQMFLNVVVSNPKTEGKNFWQRLRWIWPLRPMQDLVSYYFNVYMLRRRAQQNRFHLLNNDSDDDVWPWEAYRNEIEMVDTDAESGSESPATPVTPENLGTGLNN